MPGAGGAGVLVALAGLLTEHSPMRHDRYHSMRLSKFHLRRMHYPLEYPGLIKVKFSLHHLNLRRQTGAIGGVVFA